MIVELSIKLIGADAGSLYLIEDRRLSTQVAIGLDSGDFVAGTVPSARKPAGVGRKWTIAAV